MGERIFVTGATGRIGLRLVRALTEAGHQVAGLSRSEGRDGALREAGGEPIRGHLEDTESLRRGVEGAERIYHLAGGVRGPGNQTADVINHQGTRNLLDVARGREDLKSFLLASTVAVYGDRSSLWVEEDFKPSPNTFYGLSKVKAEAAVLEACEGWGLNGVIARIGAVYGPEFGFSMVDRMHRGVAWLPGEGRNTVPCISGSECVRALIRVAEAGEAGGIYHVAERSSPTLREFYDEVHRHVGGTPVRFWSTWIPSYVQIWGARLNERVQSRTGSRPRFTPDNLKLFTNSVRMKVDRLTEELEFEWRYPEYEAGISEAFRDPA